MAKPQRGSKKMSFDEMLNDLINNPSDIDAALLGDISAGTAKSSRMLSGQAELLEINAFIDTHNRKPQSNSEDFNESKLARRMRGYAMHSKEHADLKPFDKYDLLTAEVKPVAHKKPIISEPIDTDLQADSPAELPVVPTETVEDEPNNKPAQPEELSEDSLLPMPDTSNDQADPSDVSLADTGPLADIGKPFLAIGYLESIRELCERITVDSMKALPSATWFLDTTYVASERVVIQGGPYNTNIAYLKPIYTPASLIIKPTKPLEPVRELKETKQTNPADPKKPRTSKPHTKEPQPSADAFDLTSPEVGVDSDVQLDDAVSKLVSTSAKPDDTPLTIDEILIQDAELIAMLCAEDDEYFDTAGEYTTPADRTAPEEIGKQTPCHDFYKYEGLFKDMHDRLASGELETTRHTSVNFKKGDAFILNGVLGFIEQVGDYRVDFSGKYDPRLRLIFDNGTESNILLNTLNKSLFTDKQGRRVISPADEFNDFDAPGEVKKVRTGQVYIVKTLSEDPQLKNIPNLYKIGFTKHTVEERTKNALRDTAFLESPVEVVARAECYDLDPQGLEGIIHAFLYAQRIQITLVSSEGKRYMPQEWFSINLDDAKAIIKHIVEGDILDYRMNNTTNRLVAIKTAKEDAIRR